MFFFPLNGETNDGNKTDALQQERSSGKQIGVLRYGALVIEYNRDFFGGKGLNYRCTVDVGRPRSPVRPSTL